MRRYSKQCETILNVLRSTDTHPTANWIYNEVKHQIPNISLGTVYRNLSKLSDMGEIISLNVGDGFEHFDGDVSEHLHLHCKQCGKIYDLRLENSILSDSADKNEFSLESSLLIGYGICKNCKTKN